MQRWWPRPARSRGAPQSSSPSASRKRSFSCRRAVGHAQRALARPSAAAGADEHAALGAARRTTSASSRSPGEVEPAEVGLRLGGLEAELPQAARPRRDALGDVARRRARVDLVLVLERLDRRGLGGGVAEERLAHLVDRVAEAPPSRTARSRRAARRGRRPSRTSAAAPGSGARASRSSDASGSSSSVELAVGLVEDHAHVARHLARRTRRSPPSGSAVRSGCSGCRRSPGAWRR